MSYQGEDYGLLLHFHSHTDKRYKVSLLKTMLHRAYALSSTTVAFNTECDKLRSVSSRLDYPVGLINFTINNFIFHIVSQNRALSNTNDLLKECQFKVLRKCQGKFDCLDHEMLLIKSFKPNLNIQTDSIRAKLFVSFPFPFFHYTGSLLIIVLLVFIVCNFQIILT